MSTLAFNVSNFASELHRLKLPVPDKHTISDIADIEGDALSRALSEFKKNNERAVFYLKGILSIVTPSTRERLQRRGMMCPPLKVLLLIARKTGTEFAERLEQWDNEGSVNSEDARYVRLTLANALEHVSKTAEAKDNQADRAGSKASGNAENATPHAQHAVSSEGMNAATQVPSHAESEDRGIESTSQNQIEDQEQPIKEGDRDYASYHVYGGSFAACFSADMTRGQKHTVRIEAAEMKGGKANWSGKIAVQLSQRELPMVLATLLLWMPEFDGKGHGENNQKWFSIKQQAGKLYLKVDSKGQTSRGIPILPGDVYGIITLLIRQMLKNDPFLNVDVLLSIVRKQAELASKLQPPSAQ